MSPAVEPSLTGQVMAWVRAEIRNRRLVPGVWYSIRQISDALKMSRSPVREGLLRLAEAGLIRFTPNRGFQVVAATPADVAEVYALRLGIEPAAAYRAASQPTPDHPVELDRLSALLDHPGEGAGQDNPAELELELGTAILRLGRSSRGAGLLTQVSGVLLPPRHPVDGSAELLAAIRAGYVPVLAAIRDAAPVTARTAMRRCLDTTGRLLLDLALAGTGEETTATRVWERHVAGVQ